MKIPSLRPHRKARIEIIPLIDIMFFLLATFMMVSLSMVKNHGIQVNLPLATTSAPQDRSDHVVLTITESGELFYNKEAIVLADLSPKLERLKAEAADPKVFINGDEKAEFGSAIHILDEVRKTGIAKVSIETKLK
jgi:biopolymer transport protein ExbD